MKQIKKAIQIIDRTTEIFAFVAAILIIFIMLSVSGDVFTRYFMGRAMAWVFEVTEYALLFITFLGTAWVLRRGGHVKMDVVLTRLGPRTQLLLNVITSVLATIVFLIIAWYSAKVTWEVFQAGYIYDTVLRPPRFIMLLVIPVGSILLFILLLRETIGNLRSLRASRD